MDLYGLIGFPLEHSFSEKYFNEKFNAEKKDARYSNFPLKEVKYIREFVSAVSNLKALNVTTPHKQEIVKYMDILSATAKKTNSVNLIIIHRNNEQLKLEGRNTDVYGFEQAVKKYIGTNKKSAIIAGTGGAARSVAQALTNLNLNFIFVSRKNTDVEKLIINYNELTEKHFAENEIIINATPLGMLHNAEEFPPLPYEYFTDRHLAFDLIYNPPETVFLKNARRKGALCVNGKEMLIFQAEKAAEILNM